MANPPSSIFDDLSLAKMALDTYNAQIEMYKAQVDNHSNFSDTIRGLKIYGVKDDMVDSFAYSMRMLYGYKMVKPERYYKKPIMDRVIDLTVFYEQVTGQRPQKLLVGYEEMGEIRKANRAADMVGFSHPRAMLGTLNGMAVMQEPAKHHLECV